MSERRFIFDVDAALRRVLASKEEETSDPNLSQLSQPSATVARATRTPSSSVASDQDTNDINGLYDRGNPGVVGSSDPSRLSQLSQTPIQMYISAVLDEEEISDFYYNAGSFEHDDGMCRPAAEHRALERIFLRRGGNEL